MSHPIPDAKLQIVMKFRDLIGRWNESVSELDRINKEQQTIKAETDDCYAAARVFGFDLPSAYEEFRTGGPDVLGDEAVQADIPPVAPARSPGIKGLILAQVKAAHPKPIRASELRDYLKTRGYFVHDKTVGMTLYRLSQDKSVRRDGWDWFFVPEAERGPDKENPASGAGSTDVLL